jgi:hypothetical protein
VVASPALETRVEPLAGEVYATGSVKLKVYVRALRVGYHGIYGLALEVRGAPGLFEVPLTFANPFGIEVLPRALARPLLSPAGGRSSTLALAGRSGRQRGDGTDLRELREHLPGDPFRWIAWKASARRGLLVVKEFEREERDVVVVVLDASVELWAGPMGGAPLDRMVDVAATLAAHHLGTGDLVGLRIVAARQLASIEPDTGRAQTARIVGALLEHTSVLDADRSGWDESDLATQVTEHMRPLDPRALSDLRRGRVDKLVRRAGGLRAHAPFSRPMPQGRNPADARLRRYAACFGMHVPARLEPDRARTAGVLAACLLDLARQRKPPRATIVHVVAPPPPPPFLEALARAVRKLKARGVSVRWSTPPVASPLVIELPEQNEDHPTHVEEALPDPALLPAVERAVVIRAAIANRRGEQALRKLGIKVVRAARPPTAPARVETASEEDAVA